MLDGRTVVGRKEIREKNGREGVGKIVGKSFMSCHYNFRVKINVFVSNHGF